MKELKKMTEDIVGALDRLSAQIERLVDLIEVFERKGRFK